MYSSATPIGGFQATLDVLARTPNVHATRLLIEALDSSPAHRDAVASALLERRDVQGHLALVARWDQMGTYLETLLCRESEKLADAVATALASDEDALFERACRFAAASRSYSVLAELLRWVEREGRRQAVAARTVLELAEELYDELSGPRDYRERRDPQRLRLHFVSHLERHLWGRPGQLPVQVIEAFLLLVAPENASLRRILSDPEHPLHERFVAVLRESSRAGVLHLLVKLIELPAVEAVRRVVAERRDVPFLRRLARSCMAERPQSLEKNLRRTPAFAWLADPAPLLALAGPEQASLVWAASLCEATEQEKLQLFERCLASEQSVVRVAVVRSLADLTSAPAEQLLLKALDDPDVAVVCEAIGQLAKRPSDNRLEHLISLLQHPEPKVQQAARQALDGCDLQQYLGPLDQLQEAQRRSAAKLIRLATPDLVEQLRAELRQPSRMRKMEALHRAEELELVEPLRDVIAELASSTEESLVRDEARRLLRAASLSSCAVVLAQWNFRLRSSTDLRSALILVAVIAAVALFVYLVSWFVAWRERWRRTSLTSLYYELCKAHRLSGTERRLLAHTAQLAGLDTPCRLFLDHPAWERALARVPQATWRDRLVQLRNRLLADEEQSHALPLEGRSA
ncbi:MAG: hypothetical protein KatS3mg110_4589 [Pirellulaceae bacterium]|nr:MAG: hypothetical protein KatS3mg110_4589 [Pirellulaceae bacterium]